MKAFKVTYNFPGFKWMFGSIICEKESDICSIIAARHNIVEESITNLEFQEVNKEQVPLNELTAADFIRLMTELYINK